MKILVGIDKSPESHMALAYACHLIEHFDAEVDALYVRPDEIEMAAETFYAPFFSKDGLKEWIDSDELEITQQAVQTCRYCLAGRVPCNPMVVSGDPSEEILNVAREGDYDLIVLGSHGRSALRGFLLGTVHAKILHHSSIPVLIVRDFREIKRVLVAYRGSQCDQDALKFLGPLLARRRPRISVLHVQEPGLSPVADAEACLMEGDRTLKGLGHAPEIKRMTGEYVDEVLNEVKRFPYDLIVLGAYGHQSSPKFLRVISDEALNLARSTTRPVLVFRNKLEK
jgi:nucleotide-binding universal stress UspA family protein